MTSSNIAILVQERHPDEAAKVAKNLFEGTNPVLLMETSFRHGELFQKAGIDTEDYPDEIDAVGAVRADTEWAQEFLADCWQAQCERRYRHLQLIERAFRDEETDLEDFFGEIRMDGVEVEQYSSDGTVSMTRTINHAFHVLGQVRGPAVRVYNSHGMGIRNRGEYQGVLDSIQSGTTQHPDEEHYLVPMRVKW